MKSAAKAVKNEKKSVEQLKKLPIATVVRTHVTKCGDKTAYALMQSEMRTNLRQFQHLANSGPGSSIPHRMVLPPGHDPKKDKV